MKIRIKDSTIRLRLSKQEVSELEIHGKINSQFFVDQNTFFGYGITNNSSEEWKVKFENNNLEVFVPDIILQKFYNENEIGFDHNLYNGEENGLYILIEKDFQCLTPRAHEDESDLFTNPNSVC